MFLKKQPFLSEKAKRLLLALMVGACSMAQGTSALASDGEGRLGSDPFAETRDRRVTVTETSQTVNGIETPHNGTLGVVYGGGNETSTGPSSRNEVSISGGTMAAVLGGISSSGNAIGNRILLSGGTVTGGIVGGATFYSYGSDAVPGDVIGNRVMITGGSVGHVSGGEVGYVHPNEVSSTPDLTQPHFASGGNASENAVRVTGGTVTGGIVGGASLTGSATSNEIRIEGGKVSGDVIAGEVRYPTSRSVVTGNKITVSGNPDLSGATLKGGVMGGADSPAKNSLVIETKDLQTRNISGFQNLTFDLPATTKSGDTILTLTDSSGTNLSDMDIHVGKRWDGGINDLAGGTISLIKNDNGIITVNSGTKLSEYFYDGATLRYPLTEGGLSPDGHSYTASLGNAVVNPNTKLITAATTAPSVLIDSHFIHMPDPDENNKAENKDEKPLAMSVSPFFDVSGSSMSERTGFGSYIDVDSVGMDLGVAFGRNNRMGRLVFAPVIDYGNGDYDTYLSDGTRGKGNAKYWAAGMIVRQTNYNGLYYEGSLRMGRADVDFLSDQLRNPGDPAVSFSSSAPVLTGHLRIGKVLRYGPSNTMHIYGLYIHTHQGSMDADLSTGEHYRFASVNNSRLRLGARLTWQKNKSQRFYTEIAYQYTRNGDASASCDGFDIPKSGQSGSSGMLQLGWQVRPNPNTPWAVDLSATGWMGMQKGVSAQVRVTKSF